jgi:hypothetical protein
MDVDGRWGTVRDGEVTVWYYDGRRVTLTVTVTGKNNNFYSKQKFNFEFTKISYGTILKPKVKLKFLSSNKNSSYLLSLQFFNPSGLTEKVLNS